MIADVNTVNREALAHLGQLLDLGADYPEALRDTIHAFDLTPEEAEIMEYHNDKLRMEYDRWLQGEDFADGWEADGQPDEAQEWHDFDPDC
jgi:hypothetical protein